MVHSKGSYGFIGDLDFPPGNAVKFQQPALVTNINDPTLILYYRPVLWLEVIIFPAVITKIFYPLVSIGKAVGITVAHRLGLQHGEPNDNQKDNQE